MNNQDKDLIEHMIMAKHDYCLIEEPLPAEVRLARVIDEVPVVQKKSVKPKSLNTYSELSLEQLFKIPVKMHTLSRKQQAEEALNEEQVVQKVEFQITRKSSLVAFKETLWGIDEEDESVPDVNSESFEDDSFDDEAFWDDAYEDFEFENVLFFEDFDIIVLEAGADGTFDTMLFTYTGESSIDLTSDHFPTLIQYVNLPNSLSVNEIINFDLDNDLIDLSAIFNLSETDFLGETGVSMLPIDLPNEDQFNYFERNNDVFIQVEVNAGVPQPDMYIVLKGLTSVSIDNFIF